MGSSCCSLHLGLFIILKTFSSHAWQPDGEIGGEGTQADATQGSQAVKAAKTPLGKAAALAPVAGEIPIMMPEKLSLTKVRLGYQRVTACTCCACW